MCPSTLPPSDDTMMEGKGCDKCCQVERKDGPYPEGVRFFPTDEELVVHYLMRKIRNEKLPCNVIHDTDLYKQGPEDLIEEYKKIKGSVNAVEDVWYFFTPRQRKYAKGTRPSRSAIGGYWKATGADTTVLSKEGNKIGFRKSLVFYKGKQNKEGTKTPIMMHEYKIPESEVPLSDENPSMTLNDWVLCKIYYKRGGDDSRKKAKLSDANQTSTPAKQHNPSGRKPLPKKQPNSLSRSANPMGNTQFVNQDVSDQLSQYSTHVKPLNQFSNSLDNTRFPNRNSFDQYNQNQTFEPHMQSQQLHLFNPSDPVTSFPFPLSGNYLIPPTDLSEMPLDCYLEDPQYENINQSHTYYHHIPENHMNVPSSDNVDYSDPQICQALWDNDHLPPILNDLQEQFYPFEGQNTPLSWTNDDSLSKEISKGNETLASNISSEDNTSGEDIQS